MNYIPQEIPDQPDVVYVGQKIKLDTYGGKCEIYGDAKLVERSFDYIEIEITDAKQEVVTIDTYNDEGEITSHNYVIKEYI